MIIISANRRAEEEFENLFDVENYNGRFYTASENNQEYYRRRLVKKYADKKIFK